MFDEFIAQSAAANGVPASWIRAVIETESSWNPLAHNPRDPSWGLMGLTLPTARDMGYTGTGEGLYDPQTNIETGTRYLAWIRDRWNTDDFRAVYSAYNSGRPDLWETSREVAGNVARAVESLSKWIEGEVTQVAAGESSGATLLVVAGLAWLLLRR